MLDAVVGGNIEERAEGSDLRTDGIIDKSCRVAVSDLGQRDLGVAKIGFMSSPRFDLVFWEIS